MSVKNCTPDAGLETDLTPESERRHDPHLRAARLRLTRIAVAGGGRSPPHRGLVLAGPLAAENDTPCDALFNLGLHADRWSGIDAEQASGRWRRSRLSSRGCDRCWRLRLTAQVGSGQSCRELPCWGKALRRVEGLPAHRRTGRTPRIDSAVANRKLATTCR